MKETSPATRTLAIIRRTSSTTCATVSSSRHDAAGKIVYFDYDDIGNLTSRTDEISETTTFVCGSLNRLTSSTDPLTGTITGLTMP
jgi:YD repeat-containing protein